MHIFHNTQKNRVAIPTRGRGAIQILFSLCFLIVGATLATFALPATSVFATTPPVETATFPYGGWTRQQITDTLLANDTGS